MVKKQRTRGRTERVHLTERRIAALEVPEKRRVLYDAKIPELGMRLEPSGTRVFFWFRSVPQEEQPGRAGKPTWIKIGAWPDVTLDSARDKAAEYNVILANWRKDGCHRPSPFKVRTGEMTLNELAEDYFARHLASHAKRGELAVAERRKDVDRYLSEFKDRTLSSINRKDVLGLHAKLGKENGKYTANGVVSFIATLYNFAADQELYAGANPAKGVKRFKEEKRQRFVQPEEMPRLFAALKASPSADLPDFVNLSLWTGARKSDVLSMRWQDVSIADNRWTVPDPKNQQPYEIALTPEAVTILEKRRAILKKRRADSPWVFPSVGKTGHLRDLKKRWKEMLGRAGIGNLRQHDLRRTLGSWQAGLGVSLPIIGKSLGHTSTAATEIYARLNLDPVRESVNAATQAIIRAGRKKLPA